MESLIADLLGAGGCALIKEGPPRGQDPLAGKTLVLTGTLPELTVEQASKQERGRRRAGDRLGVS